MKRVEHADRNGGDNEQDEERGGTRSARRRRWRRASARLSVGRNGTRPSLAFVGRHRAVEDAADCGALRVDLANAFRRSAQLVDANCSRQPAACCTRAPASTAPRGPGSIQLDSNCPSRASTSPPTSTTSRRSGSQSSWSASCRWPTHCSLTRFLRSRDVSDAWAAYRNGQPLQPRYAVAVHSQSAPRGLSFPDLVVEGDEPTRRTARGEAGAPPRRSNSATEDRRRLPGRPPCRASALLRAARADACVGAHDRRRASEQGGGR